MKTKLAILSMVLIWAIALSSCHTECDRLQSQYDNLESKYDALEKENEALRAKNNEMEAVFNKMKSPKSPTSEDNDGDAKSLIMRDQDGAQ